MRKKSLHIHRVISVVLLMVFAIALTPFSILHHHEHEEEPIGCVSHSASAHVKTCTHKFHVSTHSDHCLICEAHFEKNYTTSANHYQVYREYKQMARYFGSISAAYTQLIGTSLRGPPVV